MKPWKPKVGEMYYRLEDKWWKYGISWGVHYKGQLIETKGTCKVFERLSQAQVHFFDQLKKIRKKELDIYHEYYVPFLGDPKTFLVSEMRLQYLEICSKKIYQYKDLTYKAQFIDERT
jgi:hypothetical protein